MKQTETNKLRNSRAPGPPGSGEGGAGVKELYRPGTVLWRRPDRRIASRASAYDTSPALTQATGEKRYGYG
jgi:hypothetical protein